MALDQKFVLVVVDDFDILNIIRLGLEEDGLNNVFGFTDPFLALEHFKINTANYRLVISDIRMPAMNGFEFVRRIKKVNPTIPVLLMTAFDVNSDQLLLTSLKSIKIDGFIQKPTVQLQLRIAASIS
jgi:two-component system chemotaxis response regulator CheB